MINKSGSLDSQTLKENHFGMPVNELNNSVPPQYSLLVIQQNLFNKLNTKKSTSRPIDQPVLIHLFKLKIKVRILRKLKIPFVHNSHSRLILKFLYHCISRGRHEVGLSEEIHVRKNIK